MNRTERKLFVRTVELGVLLTLVVLLLDRTGILSPLQRYLYDTRAQRCQLFMPEPTDRVFHLDIDDPSLEQVGRWPWNRTKLARILDEISLAKPKLVAFDVLLSEPEDSGSKLGKDGTILSIDHDANFADAVRRNARVLLPFSADFEKPRNDDALTLAMIAELMRDTELNRPALIEALTPRFSKISGLPDQIAARFLEARNRAVLDRILQYLQAGDVSDDDLRKKIAPVATSKGERDDLWQAIESRAAFARALKSIGRFALPRTDLNQSFVNVGDRAILPIQKFAESAYESGFVDFLKFGDGNVRSVPLLASQGGKLIPHLALSVACRMLDVDPRNIQVTSDAVIIPLPSGERLSLPTRSLDSSNFGRLSTFFDVAWFGGSRWEEMYGSSDAPETSNHLPIEGVWSVCRLRDGIERNNQLIDESIEFLKLTLGTNVADAFLQKLPPLDDVETRRTVVETLSKDLVDNYEMLDMVNSRWEDLQENEKRLVTAYRQIRKSVEQNTGLLPRIKEQRSRFARLFQDKAILIGFTATGRLDTFSTSIHPACPGVVVHGVIVNSILTRNLLHTSGWWVSVLITLVLGILITLTVAYLPPWRAMLLSLLLTGGYALLNGFVFFDFFDRIVDPAPTIAAGILVWSSLTLARFIAETAERRRITKRFRSYVDPAIVNYIVEHPEEDVFSGQKREMTVVFTDLAGFTTISEKLQEKTVQILNEYMSMMLPVIRGNGGVWNKFLGDGIMFFFGAPQIEPLHARLAIETTLAMQQSVESFNEALFKRGLPRVAMRAGVSTGEMIVGDAGSTDYPHNASDYTVLGDSVNLGARLESANKATGTRILLSGRTVELIDPKDFLIRPVGKLRVAGKTEGIMTFEPLCRREDVTDELLTLAEMSKKIVDAFMSADFEQCIAAATAMEDRFGSGKFSQLYLSLAREYVSAPPDADFDGLIILTEK